MVTWTTPGRAFTTTSAMAPAPVPLAGMTSGCAGAARTLLGPAATVAVGGETLVVAVAPPEAVAVRAVVVVGGAPVEVVGAAEVAPDELATLATVAGALEGVALAVASDPQPARTDAARTADATQGATRREEVWK